MSLKITKTISTINRRKNIRPIVSVIFSSISLPKIFSRARNIKCPPSSAGIGSRLIIARSMLMIAVSSKPF